MLHMCYPFQKPPISIGGNFSLTFPMMKSDSSLGSGQRLEGFLNGLCFSIVKRTSQNHVFRSVSIVLIFELSNKTELLCSTMPIIKRIHSSNIEKPKSYVSNVKRTRK